MAEKEPAGVSPSPGNGGPKERCRIKLFAIQGASKEEKIEMLRLYCFVCCVSDRDYPPQVTVKNTNFGHYKFESSMGTITSGGVTIGQFVIPEGRAKARSTKKVYINAELLPSNTGNGVLELISQARLSGKVELMKVIKKKKSADMKLCHVAYFFKNCS
ncbi:unnamed protein product [Ilex paraguariensis]|uniref:Uncharacterized protein n=1 Tax=Ilex paraguariensis TaxID=185542 RepID=A0ABC8V1T9_9AQUA